MEQTTIQKYAPYIKLKVIQEKSGEYKLETVNQPIMYTGSVGIYRLEIDVSTMFLEGRFIYVEYLNAYNEAITVPLSLTVQSNEGVSIAMHEIPRVILNTAGTKQLVITVKQMLNEQLATLIAMRAYAFDVQQSGASLNYVPITNEDNLQNNINIVTTSLARAHEKIDKTMSQATEIMSQADGILAQFDDLQTIVDALQGALDYIGNLRTADSTEYLQILTSTVNNHNEYTPLNKAMGNGEFAKKVIAKYNKTLKKENGEMEVVTVEENLSSMLSLLMGVSDQVSMILFKLLYRIEVNGDVITQGKIFDGDNNIILKSTDLADTDNIVQYDDVLHDDTLTVNDFINYIGELVVGHVSGNGTITIPQNVKNNTIKLHVDTTNEPVLTIITVKSDVPLVNDVYELGVVNTEGLDMEIPRVNKGTTITASAGNFLSAEYTVESIAGELYSEFEKINNDINTIKTFFDCDEVDLNQLSELIAVLKNNSSGIASIMEQIATKVSQAEHNAVKTALENKINTTKITLERQIATENEATLASAKAYIDAKHTVYYGGNANSVWTKYDRTINGGKANG